MRTRFLRCIGLILSIEGCASAPSSEPAEGQAEAVSTCGTVESCAAAEDRTARKLADLATGDRAKLAAFLREVPKGGDLHQHLSGAVYAEDYLAWARESGAFCIDATAFDLTRSCGAGTVPVPASSAAVFREIVGAWSMEGFQPSAAESGRDHFFSTFKKFGAITGVRDHGKALADVMRRAASENELYIEMMLHSNSVAKSLGDRAWEATHGAQAMRPADFATFRDELLANAGWGGAANGIVQDVTESERASRVILGCDGASPAEGCAVATRYQVYVSRSGAAPAVFAQMVAAFEAAKLDPRVVALNLVGPEDGRSALEAYDIEMGMLNHLVTAYRGRSPLRISLHAGELAARSMPPGFEIGNINHVRKAVDIAHAERIGHGVDILAETDPRALLATLKEKNVLVEICLTSNDQILEQQGAAHPLRAYLAAGVPVALATDDQGVSRTSIANEYFRAVREHAVSYRELKTMARQSLEHSFLPGESLWAHRAPADLAPVSACAASLPGDATPSAACAAFLGQSPRATLQWELERRTRAFESKQP